MNLTPVALQRVKTPEPDMVKISNDGTRPLADADVVAKTQAEDILKSKGLKRSGPVCVLAAEEKVLKKAEEARELSDSLDEARDAQAKFAPVLQRIRSLEAADVQARKTIGDLEATIRKTSPQLAEKIGGKNLTTLRQPRSSVQEPDPEAAQALAKLKSDESFAFRGADSQSIPAQALAKLKSDESRLQANIAMLRQTLPPPSVQQQIRAKVAGRSMVYQEALGDLRRLVDATMSDYKARAKDDQVKNALTSLHLKLDRSNEFRAVVVRLELVESRLETSKSEYLGLP